MFYDDTITVNYKHITEICEDILHRNLKIQWDSPTRIDCVDGPLLQLMARSGCVHLRYGVESGSPEILRRMRKRIDTDSIKKVFSETWKAGIRPSANFIIGYIGDTRETMEQTIRFAIEIDPYIAVFATAIPYPGTEFHTEAVKEGLIAPDYWNRFVLGKDVGEVPLMVKDADKYLSKAYNRFFIRPKYVIKRLKEISSIKELWRHTKAALEIMSIKKS